MALGDAGLPHHPGCCRHHTRPWGLRVDIAIEALSIPSPTQPDWLLSGGEGKGELIAICKLCTHYIRGSVLKASSDFKLAGLKTENGERKIKRNLSFGVRPINFHMHAIPLLPPPRIYIQNNLCDEMRQLKKNVTDISRAMRCFYKDGSMGIKLFNRVMLLRR